MSWLGGATAGIEKPSQQIALPMATVETLNINYAIIDEFALTDVVVSSQMWSVAIHR